MRKHALHHVRTLKQTMRHKRQAEQRLVDLPPVQAEPSPILGGKPLEQKKHSLAEDLHDWILGGQDGLVNILGTVLGVAIVTTNKYIIIVAGLASVFAESISMAAVAYTSVKASHSYYHSEKARLQSAIIENPVLQREILIDIYERKGLTRAESTRVITEIVKDKELWVETLMQDHLRMYTPEEEGPMRSALIVGFASLIGAFIPLMPFFFMARVDAIIASCVISLIVLFMAGAAGAKLTIGDWKSRGAEMAAIGMTAALISFAIGFAFTRAVGTQ